MDYYRLPKDKRWLGDNNSPHEIGGRATDISIIAVSLKEAIDQAFSEIPEDIREKYSILFCHLLVSEMLLNDLIESVSEEVGHV